MYVDVQIWIQVSCCFLLQPDLMANAARSAAPAIGYGANPSVAGESQRPARAGEMAIRHACGYPSAGPMRDNISSVKSPKRLHVHHLNR